MKLCKGVRAWRPANTISRTSIAYFFLEIGLRAEIPPTVAGLGILLGDTIKINASEHPLAAVTLLSQGYFKQD